MFTCIVVLFLDEFSSTVTTAVYNGFILNRTDDQIGRFASSLAYQVNVHFGMTEGTATIGPDTSTSTYNNGIIANVVDCKSWIDLERQVRLRKSERLGEEKEHAPVCSCSRIEYFDNHRDHRLVRYVSVCSRGINLD